MKTRLLTGIIVFILCSLTIYGYTENPSGYKIDKTNAGDSGALGRSIVMKTDCRVSWINVSNSSQDSIIWIFNESNAILSASYITNPAHGGANKSAMFNENVTLYKGRNYYIHSNGSDNWASTDTVARFEASNDLNFTGTCYGAGYAGCTIGGTGNIYEIQAIACNSTITSLSPTTLNITLFNLYDNSSIASWNVTGTNGTRNFSGQTTNGSIYGTNLTGNWKFNFTIFNYSQSSIIANYTLTGDQTITNKSKPINISLLNITQPNMTGNFPYNTSLIWAYNNNTFNWQNTTYVFNYTLYIVNATNITVDWRFTGQNIFYNLTYTNLSNKDLGYYRAILEVNDRAGEKINITGDWFYSGAVSDLYIYASKRDGSLFTTINITVGNASQQNNPYFEVISNYLNISAPKKNITITINDFSGLYYTNISAVELNKTNMVFNITLTTKKFVLYFEYYNNTPVNQSGTISDQGGFLANFSNKSVVYDLETFIQGIIKISIFDNATGNESQFYEFINDADLEEVKNLTVPMDKVPTLPQKFYITYFQVTFLL